jgi:hypothetical protein
VVPTRIANQWRVKLFRVVSAESKVGGHDSNNRVRRLVRPDCLPQDIPAATESRLPHAVAQHNHVRRCVLGFPAAEHSSKCGLDAERFEEYGCYLQRRNEFGVIPG